MAKTITDEKIKLSIIIDGNPAQKELLDLEKSIRDLNTQQKELKKEKQILEKQGLKDTERYKAITAAIKENSAAITVNKTRMSELQKEIGLTGLTMAQLQSKATALRQTLRNLIPGSADYKRYEVELKQVTARIDELRGKGAAAKLSLGSLADGFNRYAALGATVVASLTGVVISLQKIIDLNGKLSDAQADVMKTTGMTKQEVDDLTKSFGLLQTRTSRIDLLKIAEQGGRIGIAKEEIGQFVEEMNKANVALGDSFNGGVEEVANKLGKIKFLFQETKDMGVETAYNAIGSAINELGANGVASEANIAEFTTRIGSLTDVLKPSITETLALGAAFEESGIEAEVSARAYNIFMKQASTETGKFAKVMNLTEQQVKDMINTNPLEFMLKFAEGLRGMNATDTAKTLEYLGVNADGANKAIGAMGNNTERFRELINLSNKSFVEGNSLIKEYDTKNNNLAATLDKVSKKVSGWFSSESFNNWLFSLVNGFAKLIGATDDLDGRGQKWRNTLVYIAKVIAIVTSALVTNVAWQKLVALWTTRSTEANLLYTIASKARAVADGLTTLATQGLVLAQNLLTLNIKGATQAFRAMTATMMTTPWGFLFGAVASIVTAYAMFADEAKAAATAQSMMADTAQKTDDLVKKESQSFMSLIAVARDNNATIEARTSALEKAKEIGGKYVEGLTLENINTAKGTQLIEQYMQSLRRKMQLQVLEAKQRELLEKIQDKKNEKLSEEVGFWDKLWAMAKNGGDYNAANIDLAAKAVENRTLALKELQNQLAFTDAEMKAFLEKNPDVIKNIDAQVNSNYNTTGLDKKEPGKKDPNSSAEELAKLRLDAERKFADEYLRLQRQLEDDRIALMEEGALKQETIENARYKREMEDLSRQKVKAEELAKLDEDIAKARQSGDITKYNTLLNIKQEWQKKNQKLDEQIALIAENKFKIHLQNLGTIQEKAATEAIKKRKEDYERQKTLRETKFQEELAALGNNKKAREKLTKEFQEQELKNEEEFLRELIAEFNKIVGEGKFEQIDLTLLTPEQVDQFTKEAEKLGLSLQELINKRNELIKGQSSNAQDLGISKGGTDILGFTQENWKTFYDNLQAGKFGIDEMIFAVSALTQMWQQYNQFLTANENASLKAEERNNKTKKAKLKQQLDQGLISQTQYRRAIEKLDTDLDKKKADLSYKQAKREKQIAIMSAISGTAMAVVGALGNKPWTPFNFVLASIVGAMGALQLGTIIGTPLPSKGYEKGLYPEYVKREQDGKVFKSSGVSSMKKSGFFNKPTILVGEGPGDMPEMIVDKRSFAQIHPEVRDAFVREINRVKGFENGYYDNTGKYQVPVNSGQNNYNINVEQLLAQNNQLLAQNLEMMESMKNHPWTAIIRRDDKRSLYELDKGMKEFQELKNKSKH